MATITVGYKYQQEISKTLIPLFKGRYKPLKMDYISKLYPNYSFGIDVSHYQKKIDWDKMQFKATPKPIDFVFIRASMGMKNKDKQFKNNWRNAKQHNFLRGAYHYYNPNEKSDLQAQLFKEMVTLEPGDLPPILDIEKLSKIQTTERLVEGVKNWLKIIEEHYQVRPIIYTGKNFYLHHLKNKDLEKYPLWIASYSSQINSRINWKFWQFSESQKVHGIHHLVDANVFHGNLEALKAMTIKTTPS